MNGYILLVLGIFLVVLACIGLAYPHPMRDWRMSAGDTARLLVTIVVTLMLFMLLWYFIAQMALPDSVTVSTYIMYAILGVLFLAAVLRKKRPFVG